MTQEKRFRKVVQPAYEEAWVGYIIGGFAFVSHYIALWYGNIRDALILIIASILWTLLILLVCRLSAEVYWVEEKNR